MPQRRVGPLRLTAAFALGVTSLLLLARFLLYVMLDTVGIGSLDNVFIILKSPGIELIITVCFTYGVGVFAAHIVRSLVNRNAEPLVLVFDVIWLLWAAVEVTGAITRAVNGFPSQPMALTTALKWTATMLGTSVYALAALLLRRDASNSPT